MPDPKELLAKAREMALRMKSDGVPDEQIDQYMQAEAGLPLAKIMSPDVDDYLRSAGMGATFGFLDELAGAGAAVVPGGKGYTEARDEVRRNYDAANDAATGADQVKLTGAELGGGVLSSLAGGELLGLAGKALGIGSKAARATGIVAKAARGARAGAAAGAVSGAGYSTDHPVAGALGGAAAGGVAGGLVPLVGGALGKTGGFLRDLANPGKAVAREAATQVPANAAATMARQNALAPGTALAADLSPEMTALTRGIGADPASAAAAKATAADRLAQLRAAQRQVGKAYDQFKGTRLPISPEVRGVLVKNGHMAAGADVDFEVLHSLRTKLLERMRETKKGSIKQELQPQIKTISDAMEQHLPGIRDLDSRYSFLTDRLKAAHKLLQEVTNSSKNYAAARAYGSEAGSIGGNLPAGSRGMIQRLMEQLEPNRADRAREATRLLMTPGAPLPKASIGAGLLGGSLLEMPGGPLGYMSGRASGGLLGQ